MTKNDHSKQASKRGSNKASQNNKLPKIVLQFKDPKPSDNQIKVKLYEADDTEVVEQVRCFKTGDSHANLVNLMHEIVGLGNSYDMWNNGDSQKLAQSLNRALSGTVKDDWQEIIEGVNNWNAVDRAEFVRMLQNLGAKTFGPKAFKTQCKALDKGEIKIPSGVTLRNGAQRFFQINKLLPYLGIFAHEYDIEGLNKVITASLPPKAYGKYCGDGGDDLEDKDEILELLSIIDTKLDLKEQVAILERKANPKSDDSDRKSGKNKGGQSNNDSKPKSNPCKKHDGAHDWKNCPDNPYKNKPKGESKGDAKPKKELHSTQSTEETTKKTPKVRINETAEVKVIADNHYSDLNYSSDDASALMVHTLNNNQVNGITVIEAPTKCGSRCGTTVLIDNGCTGYAIMAHDFAKMLGYEFEAIPGQSYNTLGGNVDTKLQVTIDGLRLPHLSRHRTFSATFEVAPKESGDFGYGVIMGIKMMDDLGIDMSRTTKTISWGNDIEVPMVTKNHWTETRIQALCGVYRQPSETTQTDIVTSRPNTLTQEESSLFLAASNPAPSFTKAVYVKPDLLEVVKRDGVHLTTEQQALLLRVLSENDAVFQGGKGYYTGEPVKLRLQPDATPRRAKPYPIPVKDREVMEDEFRRQCEIGALRRLSPEEYEEREWASPAFGIPKKNGTIRLILDLCGVNKYLIRREFPLSTTEEILTSFKGFTFATSFDLNMGYPSIHLDEAARKILTIITPFGAYECLTLPMGVMPASDIFQARMVDLFADVGKTRPYPYIDDIPLKTKKLIYWIKILLRYSYWISRCIIFF